MSCFIVSSAHLDAILQFCAANTGPGIHQFRDMFDHDTLTAIGNQLLQVNCTAFRSRYEGRHAEDLPTEPYTYTKPSTPPVSPVAFFKLLDCLAYQCCDWPGWDQSHYRSLLEGWQNKALHLMPAFSKAYDEAEWSI